LEEHSRPLPLFLDEALTASDPQRFAAVAHTVRELVGQQGRQVFYLSAQPADLRVWRDAVGDAVHCIDLPALRGSARAFGTSHFPAPPPPPVVPAPLPAEDAAAYGRRLGVPPVDPALGAGRIHPFHLLRDD